MTKKQQIETTGVEGSRPAVKGLGRAALIARLKKSGTVGASAQVTPAQVPLTSATPVSVPPDAPKEADSSGDTAVAASSIASKRTALLAKIKASKAGKDQDSAVKCQPSAEDSGIVSQGTDSRSLVSDSSGAATSLLNAAFEEMRIAPSFPEKKRGANGEQIEASANIIRMNIIENMGVFEYHVAMQPQVDNIREKKRIIRQLVNTIGETRTFDGVTLCLPKMLALARTILEATDQNNETVTVTITAKKRRELKDCEQLFNVLFRKIFEILKLVEIKQNHYDPTARMMVPQHKLEIWPGYVVRCQERDGGIMLTCDTSHKVLRQETAYSVMQDVRKKGGNFKDNCLKALVGQVVMTEYNRAATYTIDDMDFEGSPLSKFTNSNGEEISFKDYYKKVYNIEIKDLQQPLIQYRPKRKKALEIQEEKVVVLIPELCRMTGLTDSMRANFRVMKDVAQFTKVSPNQRQKALVAFLKNVHTNPECMKLLTDWGLELEKQPIRLKARTMKPEKLVMGKNIQFTVNQKADWGREATRNPVLVSVAINTWHVVCFERNKAVVQGFIKLVQSLAPKMGIPVKEPSVSYLANDRTETFLHDLKTKICNTLQLVVIIVPMQREDRYSAIKKLCNTEMPIPSQVVCVKTISDEKKVNSVVQKVILQMNCKMGGELWGCNIPLKNLMVVGFDVYHDPTRKLNSVLGAVASMNSTMSSWANICKIQFPGQEIVDVMMSTIGLLAKQYKERNNTYPDQVIVFRDGVSDGQLELVAEHEAAQIERLFKTSFEASFAFIVVQKRINLRFFQVAGKEYNNPPPGSVLDHTIMKRKYYDFLLVSQHVTQGTVTPTHYIVIKDNTTLTPDQMQKISYKLTHQYFNWPGTVRVPAPCQYAHKLAYQVGEVTKVEPSVRLMDRPFFL